jgi:hypothetical protein
MEGQRADPLNEDEEAHEVARNLNAVDRAGAAESGGEDGDEGEDGDDGNGGEDGDGDGGEDGDGDGGEDGDDSNDEEAEMDEFLAQHNIKDPYMDRTRLHIREIERSM